MGNSALNEKSLDQDAAKSNIIKAKYFLSFLSGNKTAKDIPYIKILVKFSIIYYVGFVSFPITFSFINNLCFVSQNLLKMFLFKKAITKNNNFNPININSVVSTLPTDAIPIYSILIPLYQEVEKVEEILYEIQNLNYPRNKLDIKIVVEEDDSETLNKLTALQEKNQIPDFIQIIKLAYSLPRTKPKALNYALEYCKGEYVVIFDAEDKPDPNQLIKAVAVFRALPKEYACLQAKLNFYNANENLLTRFFSLEYKLWFNYLIKGLSILNLPIPLGGTSNHIKTDILRQLGGWDAYNVSEDAELGIRLHLHGYKVQWLNSYTFEEAPNEIINWSKQRARWIKGYIQTIFTITAFYRHNIKQLSFSALLTIYIFLGITSYNLIAFPWLMFILVTNKSTLINYLWLINSIIALSYTYISGYYALIVDIRHGQQYDCYILPISQKLDFKIRGEDRNVENYLRTGASKILKNQFLKDRQYTKKLSSFIIILSFPIYFLLHVAASYIAIWEIIFKPFTWNKTKHGVSKWIVKQKKVNHY